MPHEFRTRRAWSVSQSSGAMHGYITVQESGGQLTNCARLPLIMHVVKSHAVEVLGIQIPPPCKVEHNFSGQTKLQRGHGL
eukprot:200131-Prymnesium_polylepis.1